MVSRVMVKLCTLSISIKRPQFTSMLNIGRLSLRLLSLRLLFRYSANDPLRYSSMNGAVVAL